MRIDLTKKRFKVNKTIINPYLFAPSIITALYSLCFMIIQPEARQ